MSNIRQGGEPFGNDDVETQDCEDEQRVCGHVAFCFWGENKGNILELLGNYNNFNRAGEGRCSLADTRHEKQGFQDEYRGFLKKYKVE